MHTRVQKMLAVAILTASLGACGTAAHPEWRPAAAAPTPSRPATTTGPPTAPPTPSPTPSPAPPPIPTDAEIPKKGTGKFSAAKGSTKPIGSGKTLITYRVEVETGIAWGDLTPWTPASFAESVDTTLAGPLGWTAATKRPITDTKQGMKNASWRFQRVDGAEFDIRIRLATAKTVDQLCATAGLDTEGKYSCRFGSTVMINLQRWLQGAPDFPFTIPEYHDGVINHEIGHALGFRHMGCGGKGKLAPAMMQQTVALDGCLPNPYPFDEDGRFVTGPWQPS
ncbi:DUF3152 domain-containing protein [Micromonospora sp. NPDC050397]|uniref:DUF3152 domain-containing protein n=1 Tax=Micromonospora sp. NPDC050397 TaxID=3364279 RepID=UPI00384C889B